MFNRWVSGKQTAIAGGKGRRPYLASECRDLDQADKWRQEILREVGKLVMEIQNAGLGEHRLRDMNDQINKLTREKHHWEKQIIKLGGPNYIAQGRRAMDEAAADGYVDGMDQRGGMYRYYGAAKNLPGVKELFEKPEKRTVRRTRHQMYKNIDMDYYGMRDDDDGDRPRQRHLRRLAVFLGAQHGAGVRPGDAREYFAQKGEGIVLNQLERRKRRRVRLNRPGALVQTLDLGSRAPTNPGTPSPGERREKVSHAYRHGVEALGHRVDERPRPLRQRGFTRGHGPNRLLG